MSADGMTHAPVGKPSPVCKDGEVVMAAAHLDHGHIYGQCNGLVEAGARIKWVFDPVPERVEAFLKKFPTPVRHGVLRKSSTIPRFSSSLPLLCQMNAGRLVAV
jgi:hypothetical protein